MKLSLKEFLKKYTAISNRFIDEYYKFYEMCERNAFGIKASDVVEYLGLGHERTLHERLRTRFELKTDYIITRISRRSQRDVQDVFYYLSFDGFEKVCMTSKTEKGNQVRDYFITLRKFIDYYKQHIASMIDKEVHSGKCIYVLTVDKDKNIFKTGRTASIRKRLYSYATGRDKHPDIKFIMLIDDPKKVEDCMKSVTKEYQLKERGKQELYKVDFDVLKGVIFGCAELTKKVKDMMTNKDLDTYVVFEDKYQERLDLDGRVIELEQMGKRVRRTSKGGSKKGSKRAH